MYQRREERLYQRSDERSLGDLFSDLLREASDLIRNEARLARSELTDKLSRSGKDMASLVAWSAVAYAGVLLLLAGITLALVALGLPAWLAALLVGVVVLAIGGYFANKSLSALKHRDVVPRQTVRSLQEDRDWLREHMQ